MKRSANRIDRSPPSTDPLVVSALVTVMKLAALAFAFGFENFGVLVTLNTYTRNCIRQRSERLKLRNRPATRLTTPGPRSVFRPELPKRTAVTRAKAEGSIYGVPSPAVPNFVTFTWSAVCVFPGAH